MLYTPLYQCSLGCVMMHLCHWKRIHSCIINFCFAGIKVKLLDWLYLQNFISCISEVRVRQIWPRFFRDTIYMYLQEVFVLLSRRRESMFRYGHSGKRKLMSNWRSRVVASQPTKTNMQFLNFWTNSDRVYNELQVIHCESKNKTPYSRWLLREILIDFQNSLLLDSTQNFCYKISIIYPIMP